MQINPEKFKKDIKKVKSDSGSSQEKCETQTEKTNASNVQELLKTKYTKKDIIKVTDKNMRGEFGLFKHFLSTGEWVKEMKPEKCFYNHFALDNGESFEWAQIQWTNRVPGIGKLSHKNETFEILNKYRAWYSSKFEFYPKTFIIPNQYDAYVKYHKKHKGKTFISKISGGSQGYGIRILNSPKDMAKDFGRSDLDDKIVQEYLAKPLILDNKKHDMRIYVSIVSWDPLVAFINEEGLVRFCTEDYEEPTASNKNKENVHFTNYSLNKHSTEYKKIDEIEEVHEGSKKTMCTYKKMLDAEGIDFAPIWEDIKYLCAAILKSLKPWITYQAHLEWMDPKKIAKAKCFHIIGFDVILDKNHKPWLLEMNGNPSLNIHFDPDEWHKKKREEAIISDIDLYVKTKVVGDMVNMLKRNKRKQLREEVTTWRSWEKIIDAEIEESEFGECTEYEELFDIFKFLGGYKFFPILTMCKFAKMLPWFNGIGDVKIQKIDLDVWWKKVQQVCGVMDFNGFLCSVFNL